MKRDVGADPVVPQLHALGHPRACRLAAGMEADVYALDEDTVARLDRTPGDASAVGRLLDDLDRCGLPFAVPVARGRLELPDGRSLQLQPRLRGRSLGEFYDGETGRLDPRAETALMEVLTALRTAPVDVPDLPLLGGRTVTDGRWTTALQNVLDDRTARPEGLLARHVDRLGDWGRAAREFLASRADVPTVLQHGDICPENVLVDDDCRLTAVLDWGFLTMRADPLLEVALTAGFFDMYGPHALRTDHRLTDVFLEAFGGDRADVLRYKALYALIGADAYSERADGHFRWCVQVLRRDDVRAAVFR